MLSLGHRCLEQLIVDQCISKLHRLSFHLFDKKINQLCISNITHMHKLQNNFLRSHSHVNCFSNITQMHILQIQYVPHLRNNGILVAIIQFVSGKCI
jgi:hypothetical protein